MNSPNWRWSIFGAWRYILEVSSIPIPDNPLTPSLTPTPYIGYNRHQEFLGYRYRLFELERLALGVSWCDAY